MAKSVERPGRFLVSGLQEMAQYVSYRGGPALDWKAQRVTPYVNQVLFAQHSPAAMEPQVARNIVCYAKCLDHLLEGELALLGDTLMQHLKALENYVVEGVWTTAQHMQLVPPAKASIASAEEKAAAARAEMRAARLRKSIEAAKSSKRVG